MKKLLFILFLPFLISCGAMPQKNYKVELINGEVYHIKATGYWENKGIVEFYGGKGVFYNVKCVFEESNY